MSKGKLEKFAELNRFPNTFQNFSYHNPRLTDHNGQVIALKGAWSDLVFKNRNPITLELACGKGDYTIALARKYPGENFIGVDIKGNRIWRGAKTAIEEQMPNVAFLRTDINLLNHFFTSGEIQSIWITFPDPYIKKSKAQKRLTSPRFLNIYRKILVENGNIHLKTDESNLYQFSLETIEEMCLTLEMSTEDLYAESFGDDILTIKTFYEKMHLADGKKIKYLRFHF